MRGKAPGRPAMPVRDRLHARLVPAPDSDCLIWTGSLDWAGYGRIRVGSRTLGDRRVEFVHRVAWQLENGAVPDGLVIDHVRDRGCKYKSCANVAHLEPVTQRENVLRGDGPPADQVTRTHCPYGHPYDEANTYVNRNKRYCRTCRRRAAP